MKGKNIIMVGFGFFLLALGAIGLLIPVFPTTPFIICAVACFSSTPRIRAKVLKIPVINQHIANYYNRTGLSKKTMAISLTFLWGMLSLSAFFIQIHWVILLLFLIGIAVTIHLLWMARPKNRKETSEKISCER